MTIVGAGAAAGGASLLPEVLAFSTSLPLDRKLLREDLLGSLAHATMLGRTGIVPREAARALRAGLRKLWTLPSDGLPAEEDVHMAVEALLARELGEVAGMLHTARSRNDQVALDLRLHVREELALSFEVLGAALGTLVRRARSELDTLLPAYTHRQRAQPASAAYYLCAWGAMLARDADALRFALQGADVLPLGAGAVAGTSLPIDRELTRSLLRFSRTTANGMDAVGDRDFALDFAYAAARCLLHLGRIATDVIDFASAEFGYVKLAPEIACGSSMMPQKRNPDLFELLRGKSGRAVGNLQALLVTTKGLPGGYNRDLQEDRAPLLETGPLLRDCLSMFRVGLEHLRFDAARGRAALAADYTQATDVAEALAQKGVPFRTAYKLVGELVRQCQEAQLPLARVTLALARSIDPRFDAEVLLAADPERSVARKRNAGGPGPEQVDAQIAWLEREAERALESSRNIPRLDRLFRELEETEP